jgi:hypothetical protein
VLVSFALWVGVVDGAMESHPLLRYPAVLHAEGFR